MERRTFEGDLSGHGFGDDDLSRASFRGCDLRGADLSERDLSHVDFAQALLGGACFYGSDLSEAILTDAQLLWTLADDRTVLPKGVEARGPEWLCFRPRGHLPGAPLRGGFVYRQDLREANLAGVDLRFGCLDETDLTGANLTFARFRYCSLQKTVLAGADCQHVDFRAANLRGADLRGANQAKARFGRAVWDAATRWDGAAPKGTTFIGPNADLRGANLFGLFLMDADLSHADLRGANLRKATLFGADLSRANFAGADLREAVYGEATVFPEGFDPAAAGAIWRGT